MEKNIELAIEKEREYLERKVTNGDNTANIYDYLGLAGYDNLEEYFRDKSLHMLTNLDYTVVEEPYIGENVPVEYVMNKQPSFLYTINCNTSYAFIPLGYEDDGTIASSGLQIVSLGYNAEHGVILSFDGDLRVYLIIPDAIDLHSDYFINRMSEYISENYMECTVDNNDIMIGNKKVAGSAEIHYNNMRIILFQVTFNDNSELIKRICGEQAKEPGCIDSKILSPYELKDEFLRWLQ
jgi:hypothetical protein